MENEFQKPYELTVLLVDEADESKVTALIGEDKISKKEGPKTLNLSYPIKKQSAALLYVYQLTATTEEAETIRQQLAGQSSILRFLLITPPLQVSRVQPIKRDEVRVETKPVVPSGSITNEALEQALKEIL